jgi:peptidyl-prolyl cis-trans isomerase SurA
VLRPVPDSAAKARARQRAESLLVELRRGSDFAAAAKRFSSDTASGAQGGELGWFRRGVMVKEFEDVAFTLRPGELSDVVETPFGFHIIRIERTQPAEVLAKHILIEPEITPAQVTAAKQRADSIHAALARGASFDALARQYSDPQEQKLAEEVAVTQLPPEYQQVLSDTTFGLKPVIQSGEERRQKFAIIDVFARHPEGELTFDDVKLRIRQSLGEQLAIRHYIDQLKKQTYIDVRL